MTFTPKKAYSIPAASIDDITGADSIAIYIHPAAETAWADMQTRPARLTVPMMIGKWTWMLERGYPSELHLLHINRRGRCSKSH